MSIATIVKSMDVLTILNTLPNSLLILLPDMPRYTIAGVTDCYLRATHLQRHEAVGQPLLEILTIAPDNPQGLEAKNLNASLEYVLTHKAEHCMADQHCDVWNPDQNRFEQRICRLLNKPVLDEAGNVQYIIHSVEDITEKVHFEKYVKLQKAAHMVEQAPVAICIFRGPDFMIESANNKMFELWGKPAEAVMNKPLFEALPEAKSQGYEELLSGVLKTGEPFFARERPVILARGGKPQTVFVNFSYEPLREDSTVTAIMVMATDVTEQVRSRQRIEESQKQLLALFEQSPVALAVTLKENLILQMVNPFYAYLVNRTQEELVGRPFLEALPELAGQGFDVLLGRVMETGEPFMTPEVAVSIRKGERLETIYVSLSYQPMREDDGSISGVFVIATDVTFQVHARQQAAESEARFRSLIEEAPVATCLFTGPEMKIEVANQMMIDIWGKGPSVFGLPLAEALPELQGQRFLSLLDELFQTGKTYETKEGRADLVVQGELTTFYFDYTFKPLNNVEGRVYAIVEMAMDVTEQVKSRKQLEESEQALRTFILQAPIAVAILRGRDYVVEIVNGHALEFWGRTYEEVINRPLFDCLPELRNQGFKEFFNGIFDSGVPVSLTEHPIEFKRAGKQDLFYFNFLYQVLHGADGQVNGLMAVGVDMTLQTKARIKIEEAVTERTKELAQANKQLQQSNAELNQFAYIASHDLQEPLRKVTTYTGLLASALKDVPVKAEEYLQRIESSTTRMRSLIEDVLNFSKIAQPTEKFEKVDLNNRLKGVLEDHELLIEQTGAVITVSTLPVVEANAVQMTQLFTNLISNALKFSSRDRNPIISLGAHRLSKEEISRHDELLENQVYHSITCTDNGIGFDQQYAEKIFVIFQRLHVRSAYEGTGIGLSMCKKIVLNHRGLISVNAQVDKGASFTIILPETQDELHEW